MIYIKKLNSPQILIKQKKEVSQGKSFEKVINELRKEDRNTNFYDENFAKNSIREFLPTEQNYLCAYCMGKISKTEMKIEHFKCQSSYPQFQLDYENMLGCCLGNKGKPLKQQTCDIFKENKELLLNSSVKNEFDKMQIIYLDDGTISSKIRFSVNSLILF